ncbi:unnamed protein product, partial [Polarella glacialis]
GASKGADPVLRGDPGSGAGGRRADQHARAGRLGPPGRRRELRPWGASAGLRRERRLRERGLRARAAAGPSALRHRLPGQLWPARGRGVRAGERAGTGGGARILAKGAEDAGRQAAGAPSGPPGLPTGVMVVEQKFVDFLVGPGGQSLASINYAAGVTVALDQAAKFSGYSVANIYGPEASTDRAKLAIDFKLSQWLPRGMSRGPPGTGTSWFPAPGQMATSSPTSSQTTAKQPAAPLPALTAALVTAASAGTAGML